MDTTLKDLIRMVKALPADGYPEARKALEGVSKALSAEKTEPPKSCIKCESSHIVRNGKRNGKQSYRCMDCGKTFLDVSNSAIKNSHQDKEMWRSVIKDTINGVSIDKTANSIGLAHSTVFNMRHKVLACIEESIKNENEKYGVFEADETYVLDDYKGKELPTNFYRGPRMHGHPAQKRGISNEYICICTSIDKENFCSAKSINRARPSKGEIKEVYSNFISKDSVLICDGNKNYDVLEEKCTVTHSNSINRVNGFHSFIKDRIRGARGFATKYQNRYNALFSKIYGNTEEAVEKIFDLVTGRGSKYRSTATVKGAGLLDL